MAADDEEDTTPDTPGPVTSPSQADSGAGTSTPLTTDSLDDQIARELATSRIVQGGGPNPDKPSDLKGVGVSYTGPTERGKRYSAGLFGQADRRADEYARSDEEKAKLENAQLQRDYQGVGRGMQSEIDVTKDFQGREQSIMSQIAAFQETQAKLEQQAAGEAKAERESYLASYKEQLAGVRALAAQSGNPLPKLSTAQKMGLAGAEFAQGFLAARGIHIDVAGQVDRWVDRSMQEHQEAIKNARGAAEDQLHLYEVARQNSQDDWEARQRYRGFVIQGLQTQVQMNASRFQSDVAMARSQQSIAKLQVEADTTANALADRHQGRVLQNKQLEITRAADEAKAAIESQHLQLERDKLNAKGAAGNYNISDPEYLKGKDGADFVDQNGNRVLVNRWRVNPTLPKEIQNEVAKKAGDAQESYAKYLDATNRMSDSYVAAKKLYDDAPSVVKDLGGDRAWEVLARMDKTGTVAQFLQDRNQWVMQKVYNDSGKQINENEFQRHEALAYLDKALARNGDKGEKLNANLREYGRQQFERHMQAPGMTTIDPKDPEYYSRTTTASPQTAATDTAIMKGEKPQVGFAGQAEGEAVAKDSDNVTTKSISGTWADFQRQQLSEGGNEGAKIRLGQTGAAVAVDHLAFAVVRPGAFSSHTGKEAGKQESPTDVRKTSFDALENLANGVAPDGKQVPEETQQYAHYVLTQMEADQDLMSKISSDADVDETPFIKRLLWRPTK